MIIGLHPPMLSLSNGGNPITKKCPGLFQAWASRSYHLLDQANESSLTGIATIYHQ
jgi:hypothetical protein